MLKGVIKNNSYELYRIQFCLSLNSLRKSYLLFKCPPGHFLFFDVVGVAAKDRGCSGREKARSAAGWWGITV